MGSGVTTKMTTSFSCMQLEQDFFCFVFFKKRISTPSKLWRNRIPLTRWKEEEFNLNALLLSRSRWWGVDPCSRQNLISSYQGLTEFCVQQIRLWSRCRRFDVSLSSCCPAAESRTNLHNPWPLTIWAGVISKSYSCKEVTQLALFSPSSYCTNRFLTVG